MLSENDLASTKEKDKYWENVSPVWKVGTNRKKYGDHLLLAVVEQRKRRKIK